MKPTLSESPELRPRGPHTRNKKNPGKRPHKGGH